MSERAARFDALYLADADPWNFRGSRYEREKYRATLAALPHRRYKLGIEAGCSIGELTALLAPRCDRLIGIDVSSVALRAAERRNAGNGGVEFVHGELPEAWPRIDADLVVLSEVLYFLTAAEIRNLAQAVACHWCRGGACVLVNWLGPTGDLLPGALAADIFIAALSAAATSAHVGVLEETRYRIDVLTRSA